MIAHERGEKLRVFKFKPKRGYKRRTGHRQELTRIEVTELALGERSGQSRQDATPAKAPRRRPRSPPGRKPRRESVGRQTRGAKPASAKAAGQTRGGKKAPAKPKKAVSKETDDGS